MHDHTSFVCKAGEYKLMKTHPTNSLAGNAHLQIQGKVEDIDVSKT